MGIIIHAPLPRNNMDEPKRKKQKIVREQDTPPTPLLSSPNEQVMEAVVDPAHRQPVPMSAYCAPTAFPLVLRLISPPLSYFLLVNIYVCTIPKIHANKILKFVFFMAHFAAERTHPEGIDCCKTNSKRRILLI